MSTTFSRGENPLKADKLNTALDERVNRSGDTMAGSLTLSGDPTNAFHAATKQYVDTKAGSIQVTGGVTTFNARNGDVVLSLTDVTTALTFTPYNATNPSGYQTAANVTTTLVPYAKLASPIFTGDARAVTAAPGDNDTSIATTAFVTAAITASGGGYTLPTASTTVLGGVKVDGSTITVSGGVISSSGGGGGGSGPPSVGRNYIHNSMFNISQRGTGPWVTGGLYTRDRWLASAVLDNISFTTQTVLDPRRIEIGDEEPRFALQCVFVGNAGATAYTSAVQRIESIRRLAGKTVTVSFWAFAAAGSPKIGINIAQSFGTGGSPSAFVYSLTTGNSVTITNNWIRYTVTIPILSIQGKTIGTNGDDYTQLEFFYSSGANNSATAGNIGVQSATINLWGVQLEVGTTATPLEKPDPATDWSNCQRFYQTGPFYNSGYGAAGVGVGIHLNFPVTMRTIPTVIPTYTNQSNCSSSAASGPSVNGFIPYTIVTATSSYALQGTYTASADL